MKNLISEFLGTFILVFAITTTISGTLAISSTFGILNLLAIAFTAGLSLATLAYAFGPISGGHFNPAVTIGLWVAGKFPLKKITPYVLSQFLGGMLASAVLLCMGSIRLGATTAGELGIPGALVIETIATAILVLVILMVTSRKEISGHAPLAIGFYLLVAHLYAIPFSGASLNPARSLGPAFFSGGEALGQVWIYFAGPIIGGIIGALIFKYLLEK